MTIDGNDHLSLATFLVAFSTEINVVRKQPFARRSYLFSFTSLLLKRLPVNRFSVSYLFDLVYRSPVSTSSLLLLRSPGALFICVENRCEFPPNRRATIYFSFQRVTDQAAYFIKAGMVTNSSF